MFDYTFLQDKPPQGVALLLEEIKRSQERLRDYRRAYPGIYSAVERAGRVRRQRRAGWGDLRPELAAHYRWGKGHGRLPGRPV